MVRDTSPRGTSRHLRGYSGMTGKTYVFRRSNAGSWWVRYIAYTNSGDRLLVLLTWN